MWKIVSSERRKPFLFMLKSLFLSLIWAIFWGSILGVELTPLIRIWLRNVQTRFFLRFHLRGDQKIHWAISSELCLSLRSGALLQKYQLFLFLLCDCAATDKSF